MQDLGKERVTGVEEVEAMRDEFSLRLKTKDQKVVRKQFHVIKISFGG